MTQLIHTSMERKMELLAELHNHDPNLIFRRLVNKHLPEVRFCVIYIEGMADPRQVNGNVITPLLGADLRQEIRTEQLLSELELKVLTSHRVRHTDDIHAFSHALLKGNTVLLADGFHTGLILDSPGFKQREIQEPESEKVVRGPREGFTEVLTVNQTLIRRKLPRPELTFEYLQIGTESRTAVCISYLEGIASEAIVAELRKRLQSIQIDGILDSGYIQEMIKDAPHSPFDTIGNTERPDVVAARLLEGRVALLVEGSPAVLTLPFLFIEYFQVSEDYYQNYFFATFNRMIRFIGSILAISVPPIYIALTTYHQEMIPTPLLLSVSAARQGVPFPTVFEALLMLFIFDTLREAGTRMPTAIGQAVSIVGALVLGQAAVEAKLISAPMIIVTALTGITSLLNINLRAPLIIIRVLFIILSSFMGMYGYIFGVIWLVIHLMGIRSFGVPYMHNMASLKLYEVQDTTIRAPWWMLRFRPKLIAAKGSFVRQSKMKAGDQA